MKTSTTQNGISARFAWIQIFAAAVAMLGFAIRGGATTVVPPDFPKLVNESDYIVRAVVKSVTSEWRTNQGGRHIFTLATLDVSEVIKGSPPSPLVLEMLGGTVGTETMTLQGAPKFKVGQEGIFFVSGNGKNIYPLLGMMHGLYPILKEPATGREYIARSDHLPLQDTAEVAQPLAESPPAGTAVRATAAVPAPAASTTKALTPAEFSQRVKAAIDPNYTSKPRLLN